jgi:acetyltransferase-like isoleucine patch superfamily enzyme/F0F1-type ATP synthase membrane subunit c/vacuolar-type H+-ATPase subunit K
MKPLMDFLYFFLSFFGLVVSSAVVGVAATPGVWLVRLAVLRANEMSNAWLGGLLIGLAIGAGYYLFGLLCMLLIVTLRFILGLRNQEGEAYFYQPAAFRSAINNYLIHIVHFIFLPLIRGTPILVWFYRGLGAKIGRGTFIMSTRIWDLDMIEIGDNCVIGGNVGMSAHAVEGTKGTMRPIKIGNNVNIGADTMILPGVRIEDNVIVGANSLVPKAAVLECDSVYGGVPVQKIS